jgi:hypothetical protein
MKSPPPPIANQKGKIKKTVLMPSLEKPHREVIVELTKAEKAIERLRRAESKRKKEWETYQETTHALKERVKELNCLYNISNIVVKHGLNLDEILKRTIEIIPDAWQYPEITSCRLRLGEKTVQSRDFQETAWSHC